MFTNNIKDQSGWRLYEHKMHGSYYTAIWFTTTTLGLGPHPPETDCWIILASFTGNVGGESGLKQGYSHRSTLFVDRICCHAVQLHHNVFSGCQYLII